MQEQPFRAWLRDVLELSSQYIANLVSQCKRVEKHEGDLEAHWKADGLEGLLDRLTYSRKDERDDRPPRIPVEGDAYNGMAVLKSAVTRYGEFLDAQEDKRAEDSAGDRELWNRYLEDVRRYVGSGRLDSEEVVPKLRTERQLQEARRAVLAGDENCMDLVVKAFANFLIDRFANMGLRNWCLEQPEEAREALRAIWAEDEDLSTTDRIHALTPRIPDSLPSGKQPPTKGTGTRLRWISVLLMACGARQYPPYKVSEFSKAYESTGHPGPAPGGDEASHYEHALGFLDVLLKKAQDAGLERPADRLEAQSVVFAVAGDRGSPNPILPNGDIKRPPEVPYDRLAQADLSQVAEELLYDASDLRTITQLLDDKGQVIFQGPPGTGKTYAARKLARHLAESDQRVTLVQFHPSYAYEDFVQGFRPALHGDRPSFRLRPGPLLRAADVAREEPQAPHFLVIDDINRGNLAKVLGELYFLLEYRDDTIRLQYAANDESFRLPKNLYIIGTMNTADRSIALIDLALRRRFHFVEFHPDKAPVEGLLDRWLEKNAPPAMAWVADVMRRANSKLDDRQAAIGPSYFMKKDLDEEKVRLIWEHNVLPYVEEHLYGETDRLSEFGLDKLRRERVSADTATAPGNLEPPGESDGDGQELGETDDDAES